MFKGVKEMTINPEIEKEKLFNKFKLLSDKYHKLSLLFYELSESIRAYSKNKGIKETKQYIKDLNLDLEKIKELSKVDLKLLDLKGGNNK